MSYYLSGVIFALPLTIVFLAQTEPPADPLPPGTIRLPNYDGEKPSATSPDLPTVARTILEQTNTFREEHQRQTIKSNPDLTKAARTFAEFMAQSGLFGHQADGQQFTKRMESAGYRFCTGSENIAYTFNPSGFTFEELANQFVNTWKESPGHRDNMLAEHMTDSGAAIAQSPDTGVYVAVQLFARPQSAATHFKIRNDASKAIYYRLNKATYELPPRFHQSHNSCVPPHLEFFETNPSTTEAKPFSTLDPKQDDQVITLDSGDSYTIRLEKQKQAKKGNPADINNNEK